MTLQPRDDLGHTVEVVRPTRRVVSLVPSLTESVAATAPEALVGATDWCTHPPGLRVTRVRGTKNPNLAVIKTLRPQVVLANQEAPASRTSRAARLWFTCSPRPSTSPAWTRGHP